MTSPFLPLQGAAFVDPRGQLTIAARTFLRLLQQEQVTMTEVIVQVPELADEIAALQQAMLNKQARDSDLDAISALSGTGMAARTGAGSWATRTLADSTTIGWTNPDGVAGNPSAAFIGDTDDVPEGDDNLYYTDARAADAAMTPYEVADGETFVVPAGKQVLYTVPIELIGTASLDLSGALVEVV